MKVNDRVEIKTEGGPCRSGKILAIETPIDNRGLIYLVELEDYPIGIWFLKDTSNNRIFIEINLKK